VSASERILKKTRLIFGEVMGKFIVSFIITLGTLSFFIPSTHLGIWAWLDLTTTHRQTWLFGSTSTYHSTDLLTARGVAHLVVHGTCGSTSYETIPPVRLESSGGVLSTVDMVVQRRDGPRRLRDHGFSVRSTGEPC